MSTFNIGWRLPRYAIGAILGDQAKRSPLQLNYQSCPDRPNIWGPTIKGFGCFPIYGHVGDVRVANAAKPHTTQPLPTLPPPPPKNHWTSLIVGVFVLVLVAAGLYYFAS